VERRPSYEELAALVVAQVEVIAELRARVVELEAEVAELRGRLGQNSRNSSRPPSSDGYAKPPATRSLRRPSGRKPGGQPGHEGHHLQLVERPDEIVRHVPEFCDRCGRGLAGGRVVGEDARQVFDLPPVRLVVCEHRAQRRLCRCGHVTGAAFPRDVSAPAQYGPRIRALVIYLVAYQHLPYDRAARLLADWLGAPMSTGTLHTIVEQAGQGLDGFTKLILEQLLDSPVVHVDETGARAEGRLRWVHSASTDALTLYRLHDRRGLDGIDHLGVLPAFEGIAVHDGWETYRKYESVTHALCNVHHLRQLQGAIERDPDTQTWAHHMDALLREIKDTVDHARAQGQNALAPRTLTAFTARYEQIIKLGHEQNPRPKRSGRRGPIGRSQTANVHRRLDVDRDEVLRFAHDFRVPFDNNQAERDLRMIKLQQKISGSWRTTTGADGFLALRSYISTAIKQRQHILDALTRLVDHNPWLPQAASP
jgi:transposase